MIHKIILIFYSNIFNFLILIVILVKKYLNKLN